MARDEAYRKAEQKIEETRRTGAKELDLSGLKLTELPESLGGLTQLRTLYLYRNQLTALPECLGGLTQLQRVNANYNCLSALPRSLGLLALLQRLDLGGNKLGEVPLVIRELKSLRYLDIDGNQLTDLPTWLGTLDHLEELDIGGDADGNPFGKLPESVRKFERLKGLYARSCELKFLPNWLGALTELRKLDLRGNHLTDVPFPLTQLPFLIELDLGNNPLNPELAAAYKEGLDAVKRYLRAKAEAQVVLNEAKLIFVGEGNVGKSSLLGALRGETWVENRKTTHGVEIKPLSVTSSDGSKVITLNAWDFGGQPLYRPTHQLFFTAPAVYLVVWEPRLGPDQCCVDEWIKLVKNRAYDEKRPEDRPRILVVATHGGPKERRDHIDQEAIRKQFGDLIIGFHHVDSFTGEGVDDLKKAIARTAKEIRQVGRSVPQSWKRVLDAIGERSQSVPYISYGQFEQLCAEQQVSKELASTYAAILNELGYLIHYSGDSTLKETLILKADWLSKAISFVLEDKEVKEQNGLIRHSRLKELWNDPARPEEERYADELQPIFRRLMERFDLSYQVVLPRVEASDETSLIAQLVPGARPDSLAIYWPEASLTGDVERVQICRIVESETGQSARAEGILYRLIVRLHRYSLGRSNYRRSCHWQRGVVLDDGFNGRAMIEQIGDDLQVAVRAAYPERLLHQLCEEVRWLVENFWKGLKCQITVPCHPPCKGVLEIAALIEARHDGRAEYPCGVCRKWINIDSLLSKPVMLPPLEVALAELKRGQQEIEIGMRTGFGAVRADLRQLASQCDEQFTRFMQSLTDEAKDGPRLFSFKPVDPSFVDRPKWISQKFRLTLWCEHSRLPLPELNGKGSKAGVYELNLPREWFEKAAPFLKMLTGTLSLVLPVAASVTKLVMDDAAYKGLEKELDLGQKSLDSVLKGGEKSGGWLGRNDAPDLERGEAIRAQGAVLRQLHAWLKEKDVGFGGLVRMMNKRQEFLWVHPQFEKEY